MKLFCKLTLIGLFPLFTINASAQVSEKVKQLHDPASKNVLVVSHRGDWRNAPENSLKAYQLAIDMGVDMIEIDLAKTSDGVIVVMHDGTINRTTEGKGKPSDYTLAELKQFHLRNGLGRVTRHTIPTLEEVMLLAKGKVLVNLDKSYNYYAEALEVLKKTGTVNQALFKTDVTVQELQARYPELIPQISFMAVVDLAKPAAKQIIEDYQKAMKPLAFELNFAQDTSAILSNNKFITAHGAKVWYNSLWASLNGGHEDDLAFDDGNTKDSWDWLISHGATLLQTDRPQAMLQYLRKRSLHQ